MKGIIATVFVPAKNSTGRNWVFANDLYEGSYVIHTYSPEGSRNQTIGRRMYGRNWNGTPKWTFETMFHHLAHQRMPNWQCAGCSQFFSDQFADHINSSTRRPCEHVAWSGPYYDYYEKVVR